MTTTDEEIDGLITEEDSNSEQDTSSETHEGIENSVGDNDRPNVRKKNKSNWKDMKRALVAERAEKEALKARLATYESDESDDSDDDDSDEESEESEVQMLRREIWYDRHPDALERMESIETLMRKHSMSRDEALAFDKLKNPVSQSKKSFSAKGSSTTAKKVEDMTEKEVLDSDDDKLITAYYRSKEKIK